MAHAGRNPTAPQVQDTHYGTQRRRVNLPRKTTKGEVLFGPEPPSKVPRRPRGAIIINGENLTARKVLEQYPQLRGFLQQGRQISEKSLHAKVRTWFRKGKIPNHILNPYIASNTESCKVAKNEFEKDFFKLMNKQRLRQDHGER